MKKDILFLLKPGFQDPGDDTRYFCPSCAYLEGVLGFYPRLRDVLQVTYVDYERPRPSIVALLGEGNQGCPVLVLAPLVKTDGLEGVREHGAYRFITDKVAISRYLAQRHGTGFPH
ncbi:DUF3088 domain-containing protein [Corallococcus exercitus]|uniref:DUF3088 domain-containing protein n=1 Tax=Corallococcus exercitus TaxID=2316736 RepID=UPI000EA2AFB8|nr:DUF3088 domain-containing protein [Corallococcus exercitus]